MAKGKKGRIPSSDAEPKGLSKSPRSMFDPDSTNRQTPAWHFSALDVDGPWRGESPLTLQTLRDDILPKIRGYESMTWAEITANAKRDHSVPVADLVQQARQRLVDLRLDDLEELFRFRLNGRQRLWGIRDRQYFRVLWWDPEHSICPSPKRHT